VEKGRGNHTRRFDVPLELEKLTFDAHPTELLPDLTAISARYAKKLLMSGGHHT